MIEIGVPVIPGSEKPLESFEEAEAFAEKIGYPVILKAAAGGGGKGMRAVREPSHLEKAYQITQTEAIASFSSGDIYIEKLIENPRHIEVQILSDTQGNFIHTGERDCTIQRRHQKLIEETPSPFISDEVREKICETAINVGKSINYVGAGTVEFLVDKNRNFYFMEMNTRLQVEHPITEAVTDIDFIHEQIRIAEGKRISKRKVKFNGHSIECRINAEDPENNFMPSPGLITAFHSPGGYGIRVDSHCYAGYNIPANYDPMIGKLVVHADDREEAIGRMRRALDEFIIEGVKTTIPMFIKIMTDKKFIENDYDTNYLEKRNEIEV